MGGAIRAEIRKIFTTRLWWGLGAGMALVSAGLAAAFAGIITASYNQPAGQGGGANSGLPRPGSSGAAQLVYSGGINLLALALLFPVALGVLIITTEFRHKTLTSTVLATPARWKVPAAKVVAIVVIGAVYAVLYDVFSVVGGSLVLIPQHHSLFLGNGDVLRTLGLCLLAFVIWTLLGFGFGLVVRNQIAAVFVALGLTFIGNIGINIAISALHWHSVGRFLPTTATSNMLAGNVGTANTGDAVFSWWVSALLLIGYAAVLTIVGSVITSRRDVA